MSVREINSIFEEDWWWDAVAPNGWQAITIQNKEGKTIARMPYFVKKRKGFKFMTMPPFTQTCGPWIAPNKGKLSANLAIEKDILYAIISKLPQISNVDIVLDSTRSYILPFKWQNFRYEPRFSYVISDLSNTEEVFKNFASSIKSDIRKAEKTLTIHETQDIHILIELQNKTFERQNRTNPCSVKLLERLHKACMEHNTSKLLYSKDIDGNIHSAAYFVYDAERCYYLFSGADPKLRKSGSGSLLLWEGIKFASKVSKVFDFEGSNIEDIERFFRRFGAEPIVNYRIYKSNLLFTLVDYLKPKIKRLIGSKT